MAKALVLTGYGINCEKEMAYGATLAGAETTICHVKTWLLGKLRLLDYQLLLFPGGFSFGDELGAAKAFANRISFSGKKQELLEFIEKGNAILGVCNGFQLLVKLGILPGTLLPNVHGRFIDNWVHHEVTPSNCIFTVGLKELYLPIRHAEGNYFTEKPMGVALKYKTNPNGSVQSIAGVCDPTGRVLGMMAHPEAALLFTHLPDWTRRKEVSKFGPGFALFQNGIKNL